jgi:hypothetical protein
LLEGGFETFIGVVSLLTYLGSIEGDRRCIFERLAKLGESPKQRWFVPINYLMYLPLAVLLLKGCQIFSGHGGS